MINEYEIREKVHAMTEGEREALPRIENNNGRDYASCPACGHYHAMMPTFVYIEELQGSFRFNYCRDCGALGVVVEASPALMKVRQDLLDEGYSVPVGEGFYAGAEPLPVRGEDDSFEVFLNGQWQRSASIDFEDATPFDDGGEPTDEELEAVASVNEGGRVFEIAVNVTVTPEIHKITAVSFDEAIEAVERAVNETFHTASEEFAIQIDCRAQGPKENESERVLKIAQRLCTDERLTDTEKHALANVVGLVASSRKTDKDMELATDKITISKHDYDVLIENSVRLGELEGRLDKDIPLDSIFVPCNERISTDGDVCGKDRGHAGEHGPTKAQFERLCTQAAGALSNEWGEPEQVDAENAFWTTYEAMGFVPDEKYNLKATTQEAISAAIANAFLIISERRREQPPPPKRNPWEWSPDGYAKVVRGLRELEKELSGRRTPSQTSEASGTAQDGNKGQSTVTVTTEQTDTNRQETYSWIETKTEIDGRRREITTEVYHDATLTIERYGSATLVHEAERENGIMEDVNEFDLRSPARTSLLIFTSATMEAFAEFLDEYPEFEAELGKRWKVIVSDVAKEESVNV